MVALNMFLMLYVNPYLYMMAGLAWPGLSWVDARSYVVTFACPKAAYNRDILLIVSLS